MRFILLLSLLVAFIIGVTVAGFIVGAAWGWAAFGLASGLAAVFIGVSE